MSYLGPVRRSRAKRRSPERALHMSVEAFLRRAWPESLPYTHFPAGEIRDERTGAKLKAMGLKAGWPDFILILPNGQAAFLELKADDGALSSAQLDVRSRLVALRCGYALIRSMDELDATITRWLALFDMKPRASLMQRRAA